MRRTLSRTLAFAATECGAQVSNGVLLCGASNSKSRAESHSLIFVEDETAPYFELDDQAQGGHGFVKRVSVTGSSLIIELVRGKKNPTPHTRIAVDLARCPRSQIAALKRGLAKIFRAASASSSRSGGAARSKRPR